MLSVSKENYARRNIFQTWKVQFEGTILNQDSCISFLRDLSNDKCITLKAGKLSEHTITYIVFFDFSHSKQLRSSRKL